MRLSLKQDVSTATGWVQGGRSDSKDIPKNYENPTMGAYLTVELTMDTKKLPFLARAIPAISGLFRRNES